MDPHSYEADDEKSDRIAEINPQDLQKSDPGPKRGVQKLKGKERQMKGSNDAKQPKVWIFHCTYSHKTLVKDIDPKIYKIGLM